MKYLLKLDAWQLFLIMWGIPCLILFFPLEEISTALLLSFTFIFMLVFFLWLYAIGTLLPIKLNKDIKIHSSLFKIHIAYIFFLMIISISAFVFKDRIGAYAGFLILFILYYFVAILIIFSYVAKIIASVELNRKAIASDYIGYIFLIWFSLIGIWFIQPKIRKYFR